MSGRVIHFEIPYDDGDRARDFYGKVFGWDLMPLPEMSYTLVTSGPTGDQGAEEPGFINGGMFERREGFSTPNIVIDVPNLEEALATISTLGGKPVTERQPVGDMGFTAYFIDTEGNLVGLWENA
jgi:hypothetical protein